MIGLVEVQARVADACRRAGRQSAEVRLVAVSKKQPIALVLEAYQAGQRDFGENYVQELEERARALPGDARLHMIGHLQTNKAKRAVGAAMIHGVDSERLASALSKAGARELPVLIEVNVGGEDSKSGVRPEEVEALVGVVRGLPGLELRGLMCIPPEGEGRRHFAALRELRDRLVERTGGALPELSMGMSGDFEDAILEGATLVRVGTAIFGERIGAPRVDRG